MLTRGALALLAIVHLQELLAWLRGKPEVTGTRTRIILEARSTPET